MADYILDLTEQELSNFKSDFLETLSESERLLMENELLWQLIQESHKKWETSYRAWFDLWKEISAILQNEEHRALFWKLVTSFGLFTQNRLSIVSRAQTGRRFALLMDDIANKML